ncbi:HIT family protein [Oceanobacillus jeddahense]|uniref:HIT family protein n=1 Tax=Oceanobacillus jeddahense TaxID=1462527 RepID=UPI0036322ACD
MDNSSCPFCYPQLLGNQQVVLENEQARFLQLDEAKQSGIPLEGAGVIVTKAHRVSPFDITEEEWLAIKDILHKAKFIIDENHKPSGYNVGWNSGEVAGQHVNHAHLHLLPRYENEQMAGKGIRYLFKSSLNSRTEKEEGEIRF